MSSSPGATTPGRWRRISARVALVLGCVALFVGNIAIFARLFVFDDSTFVEAVAPETADDKVVDAVAATLSGKLIDDSGVQQRIQDLVPDDNPLVAAAITDGAGRVLRTVTRDVLSSDAFRTVWRAAVERAHNRFVAMVDNDDSRPVLLDLTNYVKEIDQALQSRGIDLIDDATIDNVGQVVALRRDQIEEVRTGLDLLRTVSVAVAALAVVLLVGAIVLAPDRRRMMVRVGAGLIVVTVITAIAMRIARHVVLDRFSSETRRDAVASLWDRVFTELARQTVGLFVLGLILALGGWLAGPSARATRLRAWFRSLRERPSSPSASPEAPQPA